MAKIDEKVDALEKIVYAIANNDIPHMKQRLSSIETNQKWTIAISLTTLGAVIAAAIGTIFTV